MPVANIPQAKFLALDNKFRAFIGGFGTGKTWVGGQRICTNALKYPGMAQGYFAPTAADVRDIFFPTIEEVAATFGMTVVIRRGEKKEVDLLMGGKVRCTVICKSMDRPESIVGFKIGHAMIDELDTMPMDKAQMAWNKIIARLRWMDGAPNSVDVTTTPEGYRFVYDRWVNKGGPKYARVHASTYDNAKNLPEDYIPSLEETYPAELIAAYLRGQFVNLTAGTVFYAYDRDQHDSTETIKPGEPLNIGMDFNVSNMSAVTYVTRPGGIWHAVDELTQVYDTPAMIDLIKEKYPGHHINVYPDASGSSRKTVDASTSDIALLRQAKFTVRAHGKNPLVKDRVLATNVAFDKGMLYISSKHCPEFARCMEQLAYDKNGAPDKSSGLDHLPDAGTYPIEYTMPVIKPARQLKVTYAS